MPKPPALWHEIKVAGKEGEGGQSGVGTSTFQQQQVQQGEIIAAQEMVQFGNTVKLIAQIAAVRN